MSTTNTPDFIVYGVTTRDKGKKDILTRLGAAWKHGKGDGINAQIQALNFPLGFPSFTIRNFWIALPHRHRQRERRRLPRQMPSS